MNTLIIRLLAWLGVIGSAVCNGWFSYSRGSVDVAGILADGVVLVAIFCSLDLVKPIMPGIISRNVADGQYAKAAFAGILFACAISYSALAAYGFLQTSLAARIDSGQAARLIAQTSKAVIAEQSAIINAAKASRKWTATAGCTNATIESSKSFCSDVKVAADKISKARAAMLDRPAPTSLDPQSEGLAKLFGVDAALVGAAISVALALIVELFAAFGLFVFEPAPARRKADTVEEQAPRRELPGNVSEIEGYILSRIDAGNGRANVSNAELEKRFGISGPTATRAKAKLVERGLIGVERDGRRHVLTAIKG